MNYSEEKQQIIYWGGLLNQRGFITATSGNISYKVDEDKILITTHNCYLGHLKEKDILLVNLKGDLIEGEGEITSEKVLHLDIHNKFKDIRVVLHAHPTATVAFFHFFKNLDIFSFEARFYLASLKVIPQDTPTVIDTKPILEALEVSNIVVLKNHGVISIGKDFKSSFGLIELLEEQSKINLLLNKQISILKNENEKETILKEKKKYHLFSEEHIKKLVDLVNNDKEAQELGKTYDLTCSLAVKNQDTLKTVCFHYKSGKIINVDENENADFLIIGKEELLKKVFNREIDPFVASAQGKVKTKGDFGKLSKWYPVLVRTFKLWEEAPVE